MVLESSVYYTMHISYRTTIAFSCGCTTPIWRLFVSVAISAFLDIPYGCEHKHIEIEPDMLRASMTFIQFMFTDDPWLNKPLYFDGML